MNSYERVRDGIVVRARKDARLGLTLPGSAIYTRRDFQSLYESVSRHERQRMQRESASTEASVEVSQ